MMNKSVFKLIFCLFILVGINFSLLCQITNQPSFDSLQFKLKSASNDTDKVKLLIAISKTYDRFDTLSRLNCLRKANIIAEKSKWLRGNILINIEIGSVYCNTIDEIHLPIFYYNHAANLASSIKDSFNQGEAYNSIGFLYQLKNNFDSSLIYYQKSLKLRTNPRYQVSVLAAIGVVSQNMGDYSKALENYIKAVKLNQGLLSDQKRNLDDSLTQAGLLFTVGDIYIEMSQFDKALENYNHVLLFADELHDSTFRMMAYTGIGKTLSLTNKFSKAAEYLDKALSISKATNNSMNEIGILNDLGAVYLKLGDVDRALFYSSNSKILAEKNQNENFLPRIYNTIGKIYSKKRNYSEAVNYLQKSILIAKKLNILADQRDAWFELSKIYEALKQPENALNAFRSYISLRDSVYNVDKARAMTSADMQFKFEAKQMADSIRQTLTFDSKMQRQRAYTISSIIGLGLVLLLSFFIYKGYSRAKKSNAIISKANEEIIKEKLVSENLLLNIIPRDVADELKLTGKVKAKLFDNVTVLFTDFVNFTNTAEIRSPQELVEELDTCFKAFDEIAAKFNIEKIKTIGDAYLAVAGLPHANSHHAIDTVKAAIEMRNYMKARRKKMGALTFEVRLGIHSGKVIAGIVGMKKFAYDVWGDTVNTAARMEQSSEIGMINISHETYKLIENKFVCSYRGEIEAKNKGKMKMYFIDQEFVDKLDKI